MMNVHARITSAAILLWATLAACAQEVEPPRRDHLPADVNHAGPRYGSTEAGVSLDPVLGLEDVTLDMQAIGGGTADGWAERGAIAPHSLQQQEKAPNIVFIMADDLGYGDLGCYGQKLIQTPRLDRMAAEGTRFTHCYAGAPVCAPSRSVLMTGQHVGHTRVRDNNGRVGGAPDEMSSAAEGHRIPLLDEDVMVAEVLKKAGYATGITGKWGLGEAGTSGEPNRQGFDEWYGYLNQNHAVFYYTDYLWRDGGKESIEANRNDRRQEYTHDLFTVFALDFIRRHQREPFFLWDGSPGADAYLVLRDGRDVSGLLRIEGSQKQWTDPERRRQ